MAEKLKTILGIDTGFRHVGYSVTTIDTTNVITLQEYGFWDMSSEHKTMNKRSFMGMKLMKNKLEEVDEKYDITSFLIESLPNNVFNGRDATMAVTDMVKAYAIFNEREYSEIHASTVKKLVTGVGRGPKEEIKLAVMQRFENIEDDLRFDVYDAIAVGVAGHMKEQEFWDFV